MKKILRIATAFALVAAMPVAAQKYPEKNIRLVVPFPTGASQILGLLLAEKLPAVLGQPVYADFRAGAGGLIGTEIAAKSPADGYTLLLASPSITISPALYKKLPFDALRDFAPITHVATVPNVLVTHPSVPAKTVKELVAIARASPGKMSYGSGGIGSANQLASELFKYLAKVDIVHVPYKGASIALTHILGGEIDMVTVSVPATIPFINSGRLRGLAVLAPHRVPTLPTVPSTKEAGYPELLMDTWYGAFAPAGVRADILERLNTDIIKVMQAPETRAQLAKVGLDVITSSSADFSKFVRVETEKWARVVREAKIRVE
ncbi:MAG: tripartite tricarboxylate transporter substrate binding protein [Burkholderiales bacterium]